MSRIAIDAYDKEEVHALIRDLVGQFSQKELFNILMSLINYLSLAPDVSEERSDRLWAVLKLMTEPSKTKEKHEQLPLKLDGDSLELNAQELADLLSLKTGTLRSRKLPFEADIEGERFNVDRDTTRRGIWLLKKI